MMNQNELYHYGVVGMKWGHRRARKMMERAGRLDQKARNRGNDVYKAKANVLRSKADLINKKNIRRLGKDGKALYQKIGKTSGAKIAAQTTLMGSYGALKYNKARLNGNGRGKAYVKGIVANNLNIVTGGKLGLGQGADLVSNMRERSVRKQNIKKNKPQIDQSKSAMREAKKSYKQENKQYKKDLGKSSSLINTARSISPSKKSRAKAEELYDKTSVSARKANFAEQRYKKAKKRYKQTKRNVYA
ncbi:hypothetical protein CIRMBP1274_01280 [Enterococcus cecorum]|nr:hypothetical protein CIRMBP1243_00101 [Enterococcus cecorum]CAI3257781.1 hypothetical protein CIRMBP1217_00088 [Enterococcus cecorum]CAI3258514.1 hypothetical protein CIRMBP1195_00088 [Enterococcus cecorum]CAI3260626.1 hypothetical protein CIRMBP1205_00123 [Enterococcus cecorum]CAI3273268.1 hypothetical protein CIRMBP1237_00254 [Enterococcus cecorum]